MLFTNTTRGGSFAKDPAVIRLNGRYFLYHSTRPTPELGLGIGIAESEDLENWEVTGEVPLTQPCEEKGIGAPAAIVLGGVVHLFYQTYGNGPKDAICHATSTDGRHFEKDPTNPIFRPTDDWCCGRAIDADVVVFGDKLMLYFATRDHEFAIQKVGGAFAPLKSDYSRGCWRQITNGSLLTPELKWEGKCIEAPAVIEEAGRLYMFYGGSYNCTPQQIGCAVSEDGVFFRRCSSEPFLRPGEAGSWNASESGHPYAFRDDDGRAYLFYQGSPDMGKSWYLSKIELRKEDFVVPEAIR